MLTDLSVSYYEPHIVKMTESTIQMSEIVHSKFLFVLFIIT